MDDFVWLLGSFVVSRDIVFDWYAMLGGAFIEQRFFYERWLSFLFGGLVAINFMAKGTHLRPCLHGGGEPQVGEVTRLAVVEK